jgi:penicillin amidase
MPGTDSSYRWQGDIPQAENPHIRKPERGFVSSANQLPADTAYPYFIDGDHVNYRGWIINRNLRVMNNITTADMKSLQTNNFNAFAEITVPVLLNHVSQEGLNDTAKKYLDILRGWNFVSDASSSAPTIFNIWIDSLQKEIWGDELSKAAGPVVYPKTSTLMEGLLKDSAFKFADNINTTAVETVADAVTASFKKAVPILEKTEQEGRMPWGKFRDVGVRHLLRQEALSRYHLVTSGGENIINAMEGFHGPSWRMVVELTDKTEAYGIYPGGQSGNPGSPYYDNFVNDWAASKYYVLWIMTNADSESRRIRYRMTFTK